MFDTKNVLDTPMRRGAKHQQSKAAAAIAEIACDTEANLRPG
jgi:hypothetical protein